VLQLEDFALQLLQLTQDAFEGAHVTLLRSLAGGHRRREV
jgi:hypothetical protein